MQLRAIGHSAACSTMRAATRAHAAAVPVLALCMNWQHIGSVYCGVQSPSTGLLRMDAGTCALMRFGCCAGVTAQDVQKMRRNCCISNNGRTVVGIALEVFSR